jgi:thiol:disulfide interchange protein DsbC
LKPKLSMSLNLDTYRTAIGVLYIIVVILLVPIPSAAIDGCGHDCKQCHKISMEEVRKTLANKGKLKIVDVRMSPVKGLWQVMAERDNFKEVYYIDFEKKNILVGPMTDLSNKRNLTMEAIESATTIKTADLQSRPSLIVGKPTANIRVFILSDPSCPSCRELHNTIKQVVNTRPDVAFHIILFPLKGRKDSYERARYISCTNSLKALEQSYSGTVLPPAPCVAKDVDENMAFGAKYGIGLTPTIVFQNGKVHFGAESKSKLISLIDSNIR